MKSTKNLNKKLNKPDVSLNSPIIIENLPLPFVHYPNHYGTFITYSLTENSEQYFCSCSENSIRNLLKLYKYLFEDLIIKDINSIGDIFCNKISNKLKTNFNNKKRYFYDNFKFIGNLCHKCNNKTPNLRWCHEMYGSNFKQYYGWYINQYKHDLGMGFNEYDFLYKECPSDVIEKIILAKQFEDRYIFINDLEKNYINDLEKNYAEKCYKDLKKNIRKCRKRKIWF